eukprot:scaffold2786_cov96-Isochrysis_galbana.AAC.3
MARCPSAGMKLKGGCTVRKTGRGPPSTATVSRCEGEHRAKVGSEGWGLVECKASGRARSRRRVPHNAGDASVNCRGWIERGVRAAR